MAGGTGRGPAGLRRQRRTIRIMQGILVLLAAALLAFAGYGLGRVHGFDAGRRADALETPRRPSAAQVVVLAGLGLGALAGALALQGPSGPRVPTPARLDELSGRAEASAIARAERVAAQRPGAREEASEGSTG